MDLQEKLEHKARNMGATYFGVADLSLTKGGEITPNESKLVTEFPFAISIGVPLASTIVDRIGDQTDSYGLYNYWFHHNIVINPLIDQITRNLSFILTSDKYSALPIPSSLRVDTQNYYGNFSNKMAASLSGLGWIGKSCLLITPDHGPRVRWGTILTDAPLTTGTPTEVECGECTKCVDTCPAQAFTGRNFVPSEPRETRMIVERHIQFCSEQGKNIGKDACGICVYVCPFGKPKEKRK